MLGRVISAADLVALPFNSASQSASVVYALSSARPVVTTSVGENVSFGRAGAVKLVRPGDPTGLAAACLRLLRNDAEREGLANRGNRFARHELDPHAIALRLNAVYASLR
jgi:glycosyltransferase involved in cell wall biosynthesis